MKLKPGVKLKSGVKLAKKQVEKTPGQKSKGINFPKYASKKKYTA